MLTVLYSSILAWAVSDNISNTYFRWESKILFFNLVFSISKKYIVRSWSGTFVVSVTLSCEFPEDHLHQFQCYPCRLSIKYKFPNKCEKTKWSFWKTMNTKLLNNITKTSKLSSKGLFHIIKWLSQTIDFAIILPSNKSRWVLRIISLQRYNDGMHF